MRLHRLATAVAAFSVAVTAPAEPPKAPVQRAEASPAQPAPVVIAAADETQQLPAGDAQPNAPVKPLRHARVTTCRCGDQNPGN